MASVTATSDPHGEVVQQLHRLIHIPKEETNGGMRFVLGVRIWTRRLKTSEAGKRDGRTHLSRTEDGSEVPIHSRPAITCRHHIVEIFRSTRGNMPRAANLVYTTRSPNKLPRPPMYMRYCNKLDLGVSAASLDSS